MVEVHDSSSLGSPPPTMQPLSTLESQVRSLRQQVLSTETQLRNLKLQLQQAEQQCESSRQLEQAWAGGYPQDWITETLAALSPEAQQQNGNLAQPKTTHGRWPLESEEYKRYGRQMILPEVGLHGQLRLKNAKVLLVGVGGLGCPAAAYLAGAGVGTIGLMDGDTVEISNLHRQVAHGTERVGMSKVDSAVEYLMSYVSVVSSIHTSIYSPTSILPSRNHRIDRDTRNSLNPNPTYNRHPYHLTPQTAIETFTQYDLVLDCTDHPTSRYLISDACVLTCKPLVSASALKTEGQLIVLNNPPLPPGSPSGGGPCYRCVFPKPPPADSVLSCGEGGILGPVVGLMGVLQALEAIKLIAAKPPSEDFGSPVPEPAKPTLLIFSAYSSPPFRSVRLRSRRADCAVCSAQATITSQSLTSGSLDYVAFCGATSPVNVLPPEARVSAGDFARLPRDGSNTLIDVRDETQFAMCALRGSVNMPWTGSAESWIKAAAQREEITNGAQACYVVCRLGNDSQLAAKALLENGLGMGGVWHIEGGFKAWRDGVDAGWPEY
jgi:adenylyltransferase/sulfurtransferase